MIKIQKPTELETICANCHLHISGPANLQTNQVSHGICKTCLKAQSPQAYYFGRRRELAEALASFDRAPGASDLNGFFFARVSK